MPLEFWQIEFLEQLFAWSHTNHLCMFVPAQRFKRKKEDLMPICPLPMWIQKVPTLSWLKGHGEERAHYSLHHWEEQETLLLKLRSKETDFANTLCHLEEAFHDKMALWMLKGLKAICEILFCNSVYLGEQTWESNQSDQEWHNLLSLNCTFMLC